MRKKREEWDTNRTMNQMTDGNATWCSGCDRNCVRDGERCSVCGHKEKTKKLKVSKMERRTRN